MVAIVSILYYLTLTLRDTILPITRHILMAYHSNISGVLLRLLAFKFNKSIPFFADSTIQNSLINVNFLVIYELKSLTLSVTDISSRKSDWGKVSCTRVCCWSDYREGREEYLRVQRKV